MTYPQITLIPVRGIPLIDTEVDIAQQILTALAKAAIEVHEGDIFVVAHTLVSKSEGRTVKSGEVAASSLAREIAVKNEFDSVQVEIALRESKSVLRKDRALITLLESGHICNFSGVDHSNAPTDSFVLLPKDPDRSALGILNSLHIATGRKLAVIISDTEGRPWRKGAVNIAIGCAGINAFKHNQGKSDLYGRILQRSLVCQVDEVASAAELLMGQADEGIPVVIVRGYGFEEGEEHVDAVYRPMDENLFT
jgi:coenzyme F420-0:L-glutamate ligase/coenzyme F420-1:gamma-L-glutamate ligase